jgi:hypothetical protein
MGRVLCDSSLRWKLNRNKTGRFVLIEVLPLMRLSATRYVKTNERGSMRKIVRILLLSLYTGADHQKGYWIMMAAKE